MKKLLDILVIDKTWARLYSTPFPPAQPTLVFHHALFGWLPVGQASGDELARSLCRILRIDRQAGRFHQLVVIASEDMLAALRLHYDGNWQHVAVSGLEVLSSNYSDKDLARHVERMMRRWRPRQPRESGGEPLDFILRVESDGNC